MLLAHEIEAARRERRLLICRTIIAVFLPISSKGRVHLQGTRIPRYWRSMRKDLSINSASSRNARAITSSLVTERTSSEERLGSYQL